MIDQDTHEAPDGQGLDLVGAAFAVVHLDRAAHDVIGRGRTLRRRRKAIPALATAGILAAALSLAAVTQPHGASAGQSLAYNGAVVNVDEAGFSVHTDVKTGQVTVTLRQLGNEAQLKAILAKAGVRTAYYNAALPYDYGRSPCTWAGARTLDPGSVIGGPHQDGPDTVITIYPSKMPAGSVLGLRYFTIIDKPGLSMVGATLLSGEPTGCTTS